MPELATLGRPALGGGPLLGDKIVKMVFVDEAGTGNPRDEPYIVLAAVVVDADKKWKAVERHLIQLAADVLDGPIPPNFSFHATELFSGGKTFTRDKYSKEERWAILDALVGIPAKFELPLTWFRVERNEKSDLVDGYKGCFIHWPAPGFEDTEIRCFYGTGGGSWRDGSLRGSSSLRLSS